MSQGRAKDSKAARHDRDNAILRSYSHICWKYCRDLLRICSQVKASISFWFCVNTPIARISCAHCLIVCWVWTGQYCGCCWPIKGCTWPSIDFRITEIENVFWGLSIFHKSQVVKYYSNTCRIWMWLAHWFYNTPKGFFLECLRFKKMKVLLFEAWGGKGRETVNRMVILTKLQWLQLFQNYYRNNLQKGNEIQLKDNRIQTLYVWDTINTITVFALTKLLFSGYSK